MLSATILIGLFAVIAVACLYAAVRVFAAGRQRGPAEHRADVGQDAP